MLFGVCAYAADISNYTFTSYNSDYGFVQKEVMSILQDRNGQMWFATWDGLYRFDGYRFTNYKARPGDGIRLESNRLESICDDGSNIWMRGYNGSVSRFSVRTNRIDNLPLAGYVASDMTALPGGGVIIQMADGRVVVAGNGADGGEITATAVLGGRQTGGVNAMRLDRRYGCVWIMARKGVWRYVLKTHKATPVSRGMNCLGMMVPGGSGKRVFTGSGGRYMVWSSGRAEMKKLPTPASVTSAVGLPSGGTLFSTRGDGLFLTDASHAVRQHLTAANSELTSDNVSAMAIDSRGDVWFCTDRPGVMHYSSASSSLRCLHLRGEFSGDASMWRHDVSIVEDSKGNLWLTPSGNGMAMYDRHSDTLVPFLDASRHYAWTAENTVIDMFVDRQDNVWFCGKYTGLEKATFNEPQFSTLNRATATESGRDVRGVFQDSRGRIWMGAKSGVISVYDSSLRFIGNLTSAGTISPTSQESVGHAYAFQEQRDGVIWIATKFGGLIRLEPAAGGTFRMRRFVADGKRYSLPHNDIFSLCIDRRDRLWIATFGGGLCYTQLGGGTDFRFIHAGNLLTSYPIQKYNRTRFVTADRHGDIWLCTTSGLLRFKDSFRRPGDICFVAYNRRPDDASSLSYNDVLEVYFTKQDSIYLCTYGGGFCRVDRCGGDSLRFRPFTTANGLRSDVIFSVQEDRRGCLWFASENGLVRYTPRHNSVETFSSRFFGRQIDINEGVALRLRDGRLLFPSRNCAAIYFSPEKVRVSKFVPKIILTRFFLDQTEQQPSDGDDAILRADINSTGSVTLPSGKNSFTLEFAALDFRDPANVSYAHKLEGFDTEWNMTGNRHSAVYNSLPPGKYILKIRSTNSDGVWVENTRQIEIIVPPSFWQTGWAWLLYAVVAVLVIAVATYVLTTILQLKQKVTMEREISGMKMKFFTSVSHEIRTPLTLISGSIKEILSRGVADGSVRDALGVVDRNSNRLLRLVNQILDIRKIESGNMRLALRRLELTDFVGSLLDNFGNLARTNGVDLSFSHPQREIYLWADSEKLDKIIFNLLSNAFCFTPRGKRITVTVGETTSGTVRIAVKDEGRGIAPERQASIFRIFSSDSEGSVVQQPHSGIGLALTKELVELHHGKIRVESELGKGSTFIVELPQNEPGANPTADYIMDDGTETAPHISSFEAADTGTAADAGAEAQDSVSADKEHTILVVEDNAEMRRFISVILSADYNVVLAADGSEGLDKALRVQPDVIISDYMMPVMDGMELVRRLRADISTSHIPIVMLSARTDDGSVISGLRNGVDAYVQKPFSADVLRARIANLIAMRLKLQEIYRGMFVPAEQQQSGGQPQQPLPAAAIEADTAFLQKLTHLLEEHLADSDLSVDDVARMLGMSRSVYFKKLKALTGIGPNDYLKSLRMQRAAEMLDSGGYSVTDIAFSVGISDPHYLSKCFKQKFGVTPTEWRNRNQNA